MPPCRIQRYHVTSQSADLDDASGGRGPRAAACTCHGRERSGAPWRALSDEPQPHRRQRSGPRLRRCARPARGRLLRHHRRAVRPAGTGRRGRAVRGPRRFLRAEDVRPAPIDDVLSSLGTSAGEAAPLLYTHGFYIDFDKGCIRATELQESAGLEGRFLWFSWPSDGSLFNYTHDEADLYWSVLELAEIILSLEDRFGSGRVALAGHSLGARGMVLAL